MKFTRKKEKNEAKNTFHKSLLYLIRSTSKKMKRIFFIFIICSAKLLNAQSTSTLMGGRSAALGFTSAVIDDEWSLFNNVAGLGKVKQQSANFAYEARPALTGANRVAASFLTPTKIGSFG